MGSRTTKAIECGDLTVVFDRDNMTLGLLPSELYRICASNRSDHVTGAAKAPLTLEKTQGTPRDAAADHSISFTNGILNPGQSSALHRLTLNVSNTCNMACKYCYADAGTYYTPGMLMDKYTALNAINSMSRIASGIEHLNFFGGEPTLNESIIEMVCEYSFYLHARGILPYLPRFGLTTNGKFLSSRMLRILRTHEFGVTISLDGPREIHDRLRVGKDDSGTYDAILENARAIIDLGIVPEFECTYTGEHLKSGIDLTTLMDFFYDTFGCRTLHCPMVMANLNTPWFLPLEAATALYADAIRYSVRNLAHGIPKSISVATRFLQSWNERPRFATTATQERPC